jgi:hypothetical protein
MLPVARRAEAPAMMPSLSYPENAENVCLHAFSLAQAFMPADENATRYFSSFLLSPLQGAMIGESTQFPPLKT